MEEYDKGLSSYTIDNWIEEDKNLQKIIQEIERKTTSVKEQAELAFHSVSDYFNVPKLPDDKDETDEVEDGEDYDETNSSVYEQLGILKYLEPQEDLRGNILTAIYFLVFGYRTSVDFIFEKYLEINKNEILGIGYKGKNSEVEIILVKKGESWFDLGCSYFTKYLEL